MKAIKLATELQEKIEGIFKKEIQGV